MNWHPGTSFSLKPTASSGTQFSYMVTNNSSDVELSSDEQQEHDQNNIPLSFQEKFPNHHSPPQFRTTRKTDKTVSNIQLLDPLHDLSCEATLPFDSRLSQDEYHVVNSTSLSNPSSSHHGTAHDSRADNTYTQSANVPHTDGTADPFDITQPELRSLLTSSGTLLHRRISDVLNSTSIMPDLVAQKRVIDPENNENISVSLPQASPTSMIGSCRQQHIGPSSIMDSFIGDDELLQNIEFEGETLKRNQPGVSQCIHSDSVPLGTISERELTSIPFGRDSSGGGGCGGSSRGSGHTIRKKSEDAGASNIINAIRNGKGCDAGSKKDSVDVDHREKYEVAKSGSIWRNINSSNNDKILNNRHIFEERKTDVEKRVNLTEGNESMNDVTYDRINVTKLTSTVHRSLQDSISSGPGIAHEVSNQISHIPKSRNAVIVANGTGNSKTDDRSCNGLTKRGDKRKPRTYSQAVPSQHCHICSRRPTKASPHAVCGNLLRGRCRKTICTKCFHTFRWDLKAAREGEPGSWECPHCRGECPQRAQCVIYNRTSDRRRLKLINHRKRKAELVGSSEKQGVGAKKKYPAHGQHISMCEEKGVIQNMVTQGAEPGMNPSRFLGASSRSVLDHTDLVLVNRNQERLNADSDMYQQETLEFGADDGTSSKPRSSKQDSATSGMNRPTLFAHLERAVSLALMGSKGNDININSPANSVMCGTGASVDRDMGLTDCGMLTDSILLVDGLMDEVDDLQTTAKMNADHDENMKWLLNEFGEDSTERSAKAMGNDEPCTNE